MKTKIQERVSKICRAKGVLLRDVATQMGMSYQSLFSILSKNPTLSSLEKLADTLDVSLSELFEDKDITFIRCPHCGNPIRITLVCEAKP